MYSGPDFTPQPKAAATPPGELVSAETRFTGVLTFVIADMVVFAMLFIAFMIDRAAEPDLFAQSAATLSIGFGLFNTLTLITSGVFMVFAVNAAHRRDVGRLRLWLLATVVSGMPFAIAKYFEYEAKITAGVDVTTNNFFMFYFALTGAHFLHFLGGVAALLAWFARSYSAGLDRRYFKQIEAVGVYWHMVDLLWLFIFPLLYLMDAP